MRQHARLLDHAWAIRESAFRRIVAVWSGFEANPEAFGFLFDFDSGSDPELDVRDGVAVIPIQGPLFRRGDAFSRFFGESTYDGIASQVRAAIESPGVERIALDVDSPGGDALGLSELSDLIFEARGTKPITAVIGGQGASAAYFIASAAGSVVAAREALVGGIGTVATYLDFSKFDERVGIKEIEIVSSQSPRKRPDPNTDEGRAQIQNMVDEVAEVFVQAVARNRGVTRETVLEKFGQGDVLVGERASEAGLVDQIGVLEEVIQGSAGAGSGEMSAHSGATGGSMKTINIADITSEWIKENLPEVAAALRSEGETAARETGLEEGQKIGHEAGLKEGCELGAKAERERIQGIEDAALPGHEELIDKLKKDPKATPADAQTAVIAAERESQKQALKNLKDDEKDLDTPTPSAGSEGKSAAELAKEAIDAARKAGAIQ
ncbi:MAG: S49 family peptidase [Planctomycetota bacterium]